MTESIWHPHFRSETPTRLLLVRHGQTTGNQERLLHGRTDSKLSDLGVQQAERVAVRIRQEFDIDLIAASPLSRARDTAGIIGHQRGMHPHIMDGLSEMNFGDLEGYTFEQVLAEYPDLARKALDPTDQTLTWPNGESRAGFHIRVRAAMNDVVAAFGGKTAVIVSHNGVLGSFLAQVQGNSPDNWQAFRIANCSLTVIEVGTQGTRIDLLSDTAHLDDMVTMITADSLKAP